MEQELALIAVVMSIASLWLVLQLRTQIGRLTPQLGALRSQLEDTQRELAELRAATEAVPAPPLPRSRSGGLDDLRAQLRAAHREADEVDE